MTERSHHDVDARLEELSEDELLAAVRGGDVGAYSALYRRHLEAAVRLARWAGAVHDPHDVAQEAFLKVLKTLIGGGGPRHGFVAYLMRVVRNEAIDRSRRAREFAVDDLEAAGLTAPVENDGEAMGEREVMRQAFESLPTKWQEILWLTEVEGLTPRELAPRFGRSANTVAQTSRRAREGLRESWLQVHIDTTSVHGPCRSAAESLAAYERGRLGAARTAEVEAHLIGCVRCTAALAELRQLSSRMRGLLLPVVLGSPLLLGVLSDALSFGVALLPLDIGAVPLETGAGPLASAAPVAEGAGRVAAWATSVSSSSTVLVATSATGALVLASVVAIAQPWQGEPMRETIGGGVSAVGAVQEPDPSAVPSPGSIPDTGAPAGPSAPAVQLPELDESIPAAADAAPTVVEPAPEVATPSGGSLGELEEDQAPTEAPQAPTQQTAAEPAGEHDAAKARPGQDATGPIALPEPEEPTTEPVDPNPVDPGPVEQEPVDPGPMEPEPVDPSPVDPNPVDPSPVDPNPVEPDPVDPGPMEPEPVDPNPVDPSPVDPEPVAPVEPEPVEPGPEEPGPVDPVDPVEPDPVDPGPMEPGPVEPGPVEPGPVDPAPEEPGPVEPEEPGPVDPGDEDEGPSEEDDDGGPSAPEVPSPGIVYPAGGTFLLPVTLTGEGVPGAVVRAQDAQGRDRGAATVAADGTWALSPQPGAPGEPTAYRVLQELDGEASELSEWTEDYIFLAPRLHSPQQGEEIAGNVLFGDRTSAWVVMLYTVDHSQEYAVLLDGQRVDRAAQRAGSVVLDLERLRSGTHTLELAYRDPVTGRLGALESVTFTIV